MCIVGTTRVDRPYPGVRQVLYRWDVLSEGEDMMDPSERGSYFPATPQDVGYFLLLFMQARHWSTAFDILAAHPALVTPWASNILRDVVLRGKLSAEDFAIFCTHIFVLDLAQTMGVERTRAFLTHLS